MSHFREALEAQQGKDERGPAGRRWVYVPYDQLTDRVGPVSGTRPSELGIVLVESPAKAARRPYHRRKLAFVLAAQRRFALEQAARGVRVRHLVSKGDEGFAPPLARAARELGPLTLMEPAERELREELAPLVDESRLEVVPHAGWLTDEADFTAGAWDAAPWRMDRFYRHVRRRTGLLMDGDEPAGGKWSLDDENREPWKGAPPVPAPPTLRHGDVEREVEALVDERYASHPGRADLTGLPTRRGQAERWWSWFLDECLEHFGTYEDAMSADERGLFHARIATLVNVHLLTPREVVEDVAAAEAPLNAREGFVRQVLGWREFVRHVHRATDGFRTTPANHLGAQRAVPPAYWDEAGASPSGLECLDRVVRRVWDDAYSHHIERLMVLANLGTLLDLSPRELTDWFWVAYSDAYDWVVEPNVLGMGTFAAGETMTTKPYVSGAAYIDRMSDFCGACAFHPKKTCPVTDLYWAFLARQAPRLEGNHRIAMPLRSAAKRPPGRRAADARVFEHVSAALAAGEAVTPDSVGAAREG